MGRGEEDPWKNLRFNLRFQYRRITAVLAPPPSLLRCVSFVEEVYWQREDVNKAQWRPIIPLRFHEYVKAWIKGKGHVTDFGGVLFSLFQDDEITDDIRRSFGRSV
jgi:hypothetical protein